MLTYQDVRRLFNYNENTGVFRYKTRAANCIQIGDIAGGVSSKGYIAINIKWKPYQAHRLAWLYMTKDWPKYDIDHINRIKTDNRFSNLRDIPHFANNLNNGGKGYYWNVRMGKWAVQVRINKKQIHIGYYSTEIAAAYSAFVWRERAMSIALRAA